MRKLLVILLILIALVVLWLWRGRDLSVAIDKFRLRQQERQACYQRAKALTSLLVDKRHTVT